MNDEDSENLSSQVEKKTVSKNGEKHVSFGSIGQKEVTEEKGFSWQEVLEGKNHIIAAKDALIDQLYQTIDLLKDKVQYLNEKIHVNQNLNSRTFSEISKVNENTVYVKPVSEISKPAESTVYAEPDDHSQRIKVRSNNDNIVFIKPNEKQDVKITKKEITKFVNLKDLKLGIQKVFNLKDGGLKIQCGSKEDAEMLKKQALEKMGNKYETKTESRKNPKIKIIGLEHNYTKEELVDCIKNQNSTVNVNSKIEVIIIKKMVTKYMAIMEVDQDVFRSVMKSGMLLIDFSVCSVFEHINVLRCFQCSGYHHTVKNCRNKDCVCIKCGLTGHSSQNCETESKDFCCPNCLEANKKYKLGLMINHGPFDRQCEVFKKKTEIERRKIEYK